MKPNQSNKKIAALLIAGCFGLALTACDKNEPDRARGPAETAGEKIDEATATAAEKINEAASAAGRSIERAGEKLHDKAEDARER